MKLIQSLALSALVVIQFGCGGGGGGGGGGGTPTQATPSTALESTPNPTTTQSTTTTEISGGGGTSTQATPSTALESTPNLTTAQSTATTEISGRAVKGVLKKALVQAYEVSGTTETKIGEARSDDDGYYTVKLDQEYLGNNPVIIKVTGDRRTTMACDLSDCSDDQAAIAARGLLLKSISKAVEKGTKMTLHSSVLTDLATNQLLTKGSAPSATEIDAIVTQFTKLAGSNPFSTAAMDITNADELNSANDPQIQIALIEAAVLEKYQIKTANFSQSADQSTFDNIRQNIFEANGEIRTEELKAIIDIAKAGAKDNHSKVIKALHDQAKDKNKVNAALSTLAIDPDEVNQSVLLIAKRQVDAAKAVLDDLSKTVFFTNDRIDALLTFESLGNDLLGYVNNAALQDEVNSLIEIASSLVANCTPTAEKTLLTLYQENCHNDTLTPYNVVANIFDPKPLIMETESPLGSKFKFELDGTAIGLALIISDSPNKFSLTGKLSLSIIDQNNVAVVDIIGQQVELLFDTDSDDQQLYLSEVEFAKDAEVLVYGSNSETIKLAISEMGFTRVALPNTYIAQSGSEASGKQYQLEGISLGLNVVKNGINISAEPLKHGAYSITFPANADGLNITSLLPFELTGNLEKTDLQITKFLAQLSALGDFELLPENCLSVELLRNSLTCSLQNGDFERWEISSSFDSLGSSFDSLGSSFDSLSSSFSQLTALNNLSLGFMGLDQSVPTVGNYLKMDNLNNGKWSGEYQAIATPEEPVVDVDLKLTLQQGNDTVNATLNAEQGPESSKVVAEIIRPGANFTVEIMPKDAELVVKQGLLELYLQSTEAAPLGVGYISYNGSVVADVRDQLVYWVDQPSVGVVIDLGSIL